MKPPTIFCRTFPVRVSRSDLTSNLCRCFNCSLLWKTVMREIPAMYLRERWQASLFFFWVKLPWRLKIKGFFPQFALLNSAVLMAETKNPKYHDVAQERYDLSVTRIRLLNSMKLHCRLEKVIQLEPNPNAYFQLGLLMMDRELPVEAEKLFLKTIKVTFIPSRSSM